MDQLDLFSAHARSTDPQTSHDAAASLSSAESALIRARVLMLLRVQSSTDERLVDEFARHGWAGSPSGIRTRLSELVEAGHVVATDDRQRTRSGRAAIVWGIK